MSHRYDPATIEPRWQQFWEENHTFRTPNPGTPGFDASRPKYYVLDMFPYPSGAGLHVGHPEGYTATDILARFKRMKGFNVLHPMGWDSFGLPAEQYAIQTGTHPAVTTRANIQNFKRQIKSLGFSYDWDRELATTDTGYVRWTQWIFLLLWDTWYDPVQQKGRPISELTVPPGTVDSAKYINSHRLAYIDEIAVWWCPKLGTVLANEEVIDGRSERGSHPCERRPLKQWMLRITAYAHRLLVELDEANWPDETRRQQAEWIGESHGAEVWFPVEGNPSVPADGERLRVHDGKLEMKIFTTCPDTLFGVTFMVLSPEHALVDAITTADQRSAVDAYRKATASKSDLERTVHKDKTGVFTGGYAINPVNGDRVPIWIADYVLSGYGTGAIMAVPAHDQRDHDFATQFGIDIREVIAGGEAGSCFAGPGLAINSPWIDGLPSSEAKQVMSAKLAEIGMGQARTTYRLRDWIFSRQRYWGEPFPVVHLEDGSVVALPDASLPIELPDLEDYSPSGRPEPILAKAEEWVNTTLDGKAAKRETNTMPQWAGSCWYYLRFMDPHNEKVAWDREMERYWMPVDLYVGGREHAVLHLLYARFWHKVLFDRGYVSTGEPFKQLFHQGLITAFAYQTAGKVLVPTDLAEEAEEGVFRHKETGEPLTQVTSKMSKSLKNVINPDSVIDEYGADTLRLYEMFMGPLESSKPWNTRDVGGLQRFLQRVFRLYVDFETGELHEHLRADSEGNPGHERALHRCIRKVGDDMDRFAFNTAIAAMMIFLNELTPQGAAPMSRSQGERFVLILAPFAPHLGEELWRKLGHTESLAYEPWPSVDPAMLVDATVEIMVQVNGKLRTKLSAAPTASKDELEAAAREAAAPFLDGKSVKKVVVVPGRLVNLVVG